ncbi:MAG: BadF/BadG/BcrA/BcrD ATPase family protein [Bacteroidota bacterium]
MNKATFVIGIDGGGTKTTAILADSSGAVLAEESGGPSNFQIMGTEKAAGNLFTLVTNLCQKTGRPIAEVHAVVAGLTGAGRESDQERMRAALQDHARNFGVQFARMRIDSDARVALEGAFEGAGGIILIAGTGSIAFGKTPEGEVLRTGGWGRFIGDEGSGYAIGRDAFAAVSKELDGRGRKTRLTQLMADRFGLSGQERIIEEIYKNNFDIASIAPLVIQGAMDHDLECERILNRAAFELSELVRGLTLRMEQATRGPRQKIPLSFIGGLLIAESVFTKIVKHKIEFSLPQIIVRKPQATPAYGAVLIALKLLNQ